MIGMVSYLTMTNIVDDASILKAANTRVAKTSKLSEEWFDTGLFAIM